MPEINDIVASVDTMSIEEVQAMLARLKERKKTLPKVKHKQKPANAKLSRFTRAELIKAMSDLARAAGTYDTLYAEAKTRAAARIAAGEPEAKAA